jgi:hypothetical protein
MLSERTMRSRCLLHMSKLPEFKQWLEGKGWIERDPRSPYEVLRMTRRSKYGNKTLLVHCRNGAEHATTWDVSAIAVRAWLKERKTHE